MEVVPMNKIAVLELVELVYFTWRLFEVVA